MYVIALLRHSISKSVLYELSVPTERFVISEQSKTGVGLGGRSVGWANTEGGKKIDCLVQIRFCVQGTPL